MGVRKSRGKSNCGNTEQGKHNPESKSEPVPVGYSASDFNAGRYWGQQSGWQDWTIWQDNAGYHQSADPSVVDPKSGAGSSSGKAPVTPSKSPPGVAAVTPQEAFQVRNASEVRSVPQGRAVLSRGIKPVRLQPHLLLPLLTSSSLYLLRGRVCSTLGSGPPESCSEGPKRFGSPQEFARSSRFKGGSIRGHDC